MKMKSLYIKTTWVIFLGVISLTASAYKSVYVRRGSEGAFNNEQVKAAACAPATGLRDLEWNNVKAKIETGGNMWTDRANSRAAYEVPKGGGVSALYAGALWLGGKSPDQQLKLAAITFRADGNDYWPGPLTNDGSASVNEATCDQYDRFFVSYRQDAQRHRAFFDCQSSGGDDCEEGYSIPGYFYNYPAIGNTAAGQDLYLAPFYDYDQDGFYNPQNGDYPWYDFLREVNCASRKREDIVPLFGDETFYWIFNDKGNAHTESQGQPIGMEIRAQAFAFTSNDEINNMTFYNYVLINQGTQTLTDTYFGSWVDADLGTSVDDYVGCDVKRGLGYCYNGDAFDQPTSSSFGYGLNPPAVGVDFFEGPYQDEDLIDNPLTTDIINATDSSGIPYKGLGIGYGDGVADNERFGMRRFVYYNNNLNPVNGEPQVAAHFYNYMKGIWKNGAEMLYGGNGVSGNGVLTGVPAQYMFPDDTDPYNWGTFGVTVTPWTEESSGNVAADRRFIQSAGPFTLEPGDYNNITMGVVWARATGGEPFESVKLLRQYDDKAQALFDNCFELVSGPDAPDVAVRELDREVILMLSNDNIVSTNYNEAYGPQQGGFDPSIPEELADGTQLDTVARSYKFEGYLVYQLANADVKANDLGDIAKARLIAQCDIENEVANIVNFNRDPISGYIVPELKVQGSNEGIQRSYQVTTDAFAQGDNRLINHKTYYFMVLAYGYNNYQPYDVGAEAGQDEAFLASRKAAIGEIPVIAAIPHNTQPAFGGSILNAQYGDGVALTRIEGKGSGLNAMTLDPKTEAEILNNINVSECTYLPGMGPVDVKVVDPLALPAADFELRLSATDNSETSPDSMAWELRNLTTGEVITSSHSFRLGSEDILLEYGLSINWSQYEFLKDGVSIKHYTQLVSSSLEYDNPEQPWYVGIEDQEGFTSANWIRAGSVKTEGTDQQALFEQLYDDYEQGSGDEPFTDGSEKYEGVVGGTWSPYCLVSYSMPDFDDDGDATTPLVTINNLAPTISDLKGDNYAIDTKRRSSIRGLNNVDIVFTSDKSKWTRCPVLEMNANGLAQDNETISNGTAEKMKMRHHLSVDKNGRKLGDPGYNAAEGDLAGAWGMGWFPGYAIDLGTGERLNMAFGEDSWLAGDNGNDMMWNPTANLVSTQTFADVGGGQHWIYVFKNFANEDNDEGLMPAYDNGQYMFNALSSSSLSTSNWKKIFRACTWVGSGLLAQGYSLNSVEDGLIPNDLRVRLRVAKEYEKFRYNNGDVFDLTFAQNTWRPLYRFSTKGLAPVINDNASATDALDMINIVPNPYYAFSTYETSKLDNRVKITNLPEVCLVTIYDMNGTLIRQFNKADPLTSIDWDLKNSKNVPIASGTYIIHVKVEGVGEKVLKWFGVMRPVDLDNF